LCAITRSLAILAGYFCSLVVAVFGIAVVFAALAQAVPSEGAWTFIGVSPVLMLASPIVGVGLVLLVAVVTAVPALVFVVACEILGWRFLGPYLVFGAVVGAVAYYTFSFRVIFGIGAIAATEMAAFAVAGALGGLVYWAVAGRRAGDWTADRVP
jgi:hypothetical protein